MKKYLFIMTEEMRTKFNNIYPRKLYNPDDEDYDVLYDTSIISEDLYITKELPEDRENILYKNNLYMAYVCKENYIYKHIKVDPNDIIGSLNYILDLLLRTEYDILKKTNLIRKSAIYDTVDRFNAVSIIEFEEYEQATFIKTSDNIELLRKNINRIAEFLKEVYGDSVKLINCSYKEILSMFLDRDDKLEELKNTILRNIKYNNLDITDNELDKLFNSIKDDLNNKEEKEV